MKTLLAFNVGSSTLKCAAYPASAGATPRLTLEIDLASGTCTTGGELPAALQKFPAGTRAEDAAAAIIAAVERLPGITLAGCAHRVVHGGLRCSGPARIDAEVLAELEHLAPLCPLHQPPALAVIRHLLQQHPSLPQVAAFDTAFHLAQPALATRYALPQLPGDDMLRAFGFHGLSCQSVLRTLARDHAAVAGGRLLIAHLGSGASITAVAQGRSMASSMGFSTLEGLPMATRCGHLDPGILLYLLQSGWDAARLTQLLYKESGLLGLSGSSGDMHVLLATDSEAARFAVEFFCYRAAREAGSLLAALEGLDALVFCGGIGEHRPAVRENIVRRLAWLGMELDAEANLRSDAVISTAASALPVLVIRTDEQQELLHAALECLP